jgi:GT2 family glycosyltransferase
MKAGTTAEVADLSIIVLTWNQQQLTLDCLESLEQLIRPAAEVIVVDNGSDDDTVAAVRAAYPDVVMIENGDNLGFVGGNNAGIEHALRGNAKYIMLLNNDTILDPALVDELLAVMEADSSIGISGPKMLYFDHPHVIWCAGNRIDWRTGDSLRLQCEEEDREIVEVPRDVDFITGCAICLRREVIESIGLLDTRFFIYYEETDWCVRARKAGWRTVYVPEARLWHKVSAAMGASSPATDYYMTRNVLLFLSKNLQGSQRIWSLAWSIGRTLRIMAVYSVKNRTKERLRSRRVRYLALRDAALQRWGKMGTDVATVCYYRPPR